MSSARYSYKMLIVSILSGILLSGGLALAQTPAILTLQYLNQTPCLSISGSVSNACTVQFATDLRGINAWHYLANFQLTNTPASFLDTNQLSGSARFYRVFTQELPANVSPIPNMIWVSPGSFTMGSPTTEALRGADEMEHPVMLSRGFFIGQYLVTQSNYLTLTGINPSFFSTNTVFSQDLSRPVDSVGWSDVTNFCALLTQQEISAGRLPATGWTYRLPTESEWEYACRAGTITAFYFGNQLRSGMANFDGRNEYDSTSGTITNSSGTYLSRTTPVGNYEANRWGLFDTCGNLFEWCQDLYGPYPDGSVTDPQGGTTGTDRVLRGGGWDAPAQYCRSAQRIYSSVTSFDVGFRIVLAPN